MKSTTLLLALSLCPPIWAQAETIPPEIDCIFQRYCQMADDLLPILKSATDQASAEEAAPLLSKQMLTLYELKKEFAKLDTLPDELKSAISKKYELPMRKSMGDVYAEIYRLQKAQCFGNINFAKALQVYCTLLSQ